jgi:predicted metal-dependent hydrolase
MDAALRAGVAVYNAGEHHAAHDAWEEEWLDLPDGSEDERLLHGLIQYTAAVYHARRLNWSGATGLARSAREYLADLPATYRGVDVDRARAALAALERDPERVERGPPAPLRYEGRTLALGDLADDFDAAAVAARVLAEEYEDRYDPGVLADAVRYAREELDEGGARTRFTTFVVDFAVDPDSRALVYDRLRSHVRRRRSRDRDVEGLFEES